MNARLFLIIVAILLNLLSCSGDKNDTQIPKSQTPTTLNSPNAKDLQSNSHVSGTKSTNISGVASTSEHMSGQ